MIRPFKILFIASSVLITTPLAPWHTSIANSADPDAATGKQHVYIGTYSGPKSHGIYRAEFDPANGQLSAPELVGEAGNPAFLAIHPSHKFLYAVNDEAQKAGVAAFTIDQRTGKLTRLGPTAACGGLPCYVTVDLSGRCVLTASHRSGTVAALPIGSDGSLSDATGVLQHADDDAKQPRGAHAHCIDIAFDNRIAVAADAGIDKLYVYRLDPVPARLTPSDPPVVTVKHGSAPRHFAFHPGRKFAYCNTEAKSQIIAFAYDAALGKLSEIETLSTLPDAYSGGNSTAEIQVHPNGRFVYVSNRGHDSIAIFAIDPQTGRLTALGHQPSGGKTPRNFGVDLSGQFLLAANQESGNITVFRIDPHTGKLAPTGQSVEVGAPMCVKFLPLEG